MNKYNIAILGGGVMGLSCAYNLQKTGHKITLYDPKEFPAKNASTRAGGMLAPYAEIDHMNEDWIKAGLAGIEFWAEFSKIHDIGFHQNGSLLIAHNEDHHMLTRFERYLQGLGQWQKCNPQMIEAQIPSKFRSSLFLEREAHLNPATTHNALYQTTKNLGVSYISQAKSPEDIRHDYDFIIDCRGMGASSKASDLRGVKGELAYVHNPDFILTRPVRIMHPRYPLYIIPRKNYVFMIGATQIESESTENIQLRSAMELLSALYSLHPSFAEADILEITSGIRPTYPNNLPQIRISDTVISCNGLFRHGWLLAPVMAQCVSAIIDERDNEFMSLLKGDHDEHHAKRRAHNA